MENTGELLAEKLRVEGARTVSFFSQLALERWCQHVFESEMHEVWTVRDVLDHLITSEELLQPFFHMIASGGSGVPVGFSIDQANDSAHGSLSGITLEAALARFASCREATATFVGTLSSAQLAIVARHPFLGMSRLEDMLRLLILHSSQHVKDVKRSVTK